MKFQEILKPNIVSPWVRRWRGFVAMATLSVLTACGGGGGAEVVSGGLPPIETVSTGQLDAAVIPVGVVGAQSITPVYDTEGRVIAVDVNDPATAAKVKPGAILVLPATATVPSGLTLKVVTSTPTADGVRITFTQPMVNEVFDNLEIRLRKDLTAGDVTGVALASGIKLVAQAQPNTQVGVKVFPAGAEGMTLVFNPKLESPTTVSNGTWTDILTGDEYRRGGNYSLGKKIGFKIEKLVLADKDGKYLVDNGTRARGPTGFIKVTDATTNDQLRLNGDVTLNNSAIDFDIKIQDRNVMRMGARMNGTIETKLNLGYQWQDAVSLTDTAGEVKNGYKVGSGFELEGVDFGDERIVLGNVGIGLVTLAPTVVGSVGNTIPPLTIGAVLSLSLGMKGDLTADVSTGFNYTAYFDQGMYLGKNDKSEALKVLQKYNIFSHGDYPNPNVSGARRATQADVDKKPFFSWGADGSMSYNFTSQLGVDLSVVMAGMIPVQINNPMVAVQSGAIKGSAWLREAGWDIVGCTQATFRADLKSIFVARLQGKVDGPWDLDGQIDLVDKKYTMGSLVVVPQTGTPMGCTVDLRPSVTYTENPTDLPTPAPGKTTIRFAGDALWEARNTLSKSGAAEVDTWEWKFGESLIKDVANAVTRPDPQYPIYTYDNPGTYNVTLKVKDKYGQVVEVTKDVVIKTGTINVSSATPTVFETVTLWISDVYATVKSVVWNFGLGIAEQTVAVTNSVSTVVNQAFSSVGTKTITATFKDAANAVRSTASTTITVSAVKHVIEIGKDSGFNNPTLENLYEAKKIGLDTSDGTLRLPLIVGEVDSTFPYIWIANSGEGTVSKLATRDHSRKSPQTGEQELVKVGQELGRYLTGPGNGNPSRTTVDQDGNLWVGNRDNNTITKIGLFEFGNCIDRNGNGKIDTSIGKDNVKIWSGYFGDGQGFINAQDECVLQHVTLQAGGVDTPTDIRLIAIDKDNNVFAGGHNRALIFKVDGKTGNIINSKMTNGSFYGGLIDKNNNLWSISRNFHGTGMVHKVSNDLSTSEIISTNFDAYGIALDKYGKIWVTSLNTTEFATFNPADINGTLKVFNQQGRGGGCYAQGVAVDDNDNIFIAGSICNSDSVVGHYKQTINGNDTSVQFVANYQVSSGPTGVAVDGSGNIWSTDYNNNAVSRITLSADPANAKVDTFPVGSTPYNYSDMTGRTVRNITNRQGTWEAIFDGDVSNFEWKRVVWSLKQQLPEGTAVAAYAKTANTKVELGGKQYQTVENNQAMAGMNGRFIKVKFSLTSANAASTPEITGIDLQ